MGIIGFIALLGFLFWIKELLSGTSGNRKQTVDAIFDGNAADAYLSYLIQTQSPISREELLRKKYEAINAGKFPPKQSKEWYDQHPREKAFYREYYESLKYGSKARNEELHDKVIQELRQLQEDLKNKNERY